MEITPYLVQALSPLHAGTGQSAGVIDLPIARMRATGIPFVPGSSLKGVLRSVTLPTESPERDVHTAAFGPRRVQDGPEGDIALDHAGALIVADARLLALPVRSFAGTFALVTSPLLLDLARRDLVETPSVANVPERFPRLSGRRAVVAAGPRCVNVHKDCLFLEDLDLPVKKEAMVADWARLITAAVPKSERRLIGERLVVVDDETMAFLWDTATEVTTRIRIDPTSETVEDGALWTEEYLPAETLLIGLLAARPSMRQGCARSAKELLAWTLERCGNALQLGGKATIGRGRCRLLTWPTTDKRTKEKRHHAHP